MLGRVAKVGQTMVEAAAASWWTGPARAGPSFRTERDMGAPPEVMAIMMVTMV